MSLIAPLKTPANRTQILQASESLGVLGGGNRSLGELMAALCDPAVTAAEIASLIAKQPSLCARVLRVANSPYYGQLRAVKTINRAVALLGLDAVRGIASAACVNRAMMRQLHRSCIDMTALLHHSLATAVAAEWMARITHEGLAAEAFIAGLLHNLGVAVQVYIDQSGVSAMIEARRLDGAKSIRLLEAEHSSVRHEDCIAVIFEAWQLPPSLLAAVAHHHNPDAAPLAHRPLAALVNVGAALAVAGGHTFCLEAAVVDHDIPAAQLLGLGAEDMRRTTVALSTRMHGLRRALL